MTEKSCCWRDQSAHCAASLADATRWLAWWSLNLLVDWGTVLGGFQDEGFAADLPRPRPVRHEVALRRELRSGLAQIESDLAARAPRTGPAPAS